MRAKNAELYREALAGAGVELPVVGPDNSHIYHLYVIRTPKREALRAKLNEKGIGTGIHYPVPIHLQKSCSHLGYNQGDFPVTETVTAEILSLPMYAELTPEQIQRVGEAVREFMAEPTPA
jgi:dTDP-4-amino-4,6-dideoxygalactose transaminase